MNTKELKTITSQFSDISVLIEERNTLLTATNKVRRRLKTRLSKYTFLSELVRVNGSGDTLVKAVVNFFKAIGITDIENVDKKYGDEDLRVLVGDILILIEVTGGNAPTPDDNKVHQISKHIPKRQAKHPDLKVFGVFIVNHDNRQHFSKRNKKPFSQKIQETAISHKYTITTTVDLLSAFIQFKRGILTSENIIEKLCSTGELKILGV